MKNLTSTAISTAELDQDIKDFLPPDSRHQTLTLLDELSRRLASDDAKAKHARDARTAEREAAVNRAIRNDFAVLKATPARKRTSTLKEYMELTPEEYGVVPTEEVIRRCLRKYPF